MSRPRAPSWEPAILTPDTLGRNSSDLSQRFAAVVSVISPRIDHETSQSHRQSLSAILSPREEPPPSPSRSGGEQKREEKLGRKGERETGSPSTLPSGRNLFESRCSASLPAPAAQQQKLPELSDLIRTSGSLYVKKEDPSSAFSSLSPLPAPSTSSPVGPDPGTDLTSSSSIVFSLQPLQSPNSGNALGRRCHVASCTSMARSRRLCTAHGGGKKCSAPLCSNIAQSRGLCRSHGGGSRCKMTGCQRSAQSRGLCRTHGGGQICREQGCSSSVVSGGRCRAHGGGKLCVEKACGNVAQSLGRCRAHSTEGTGGGGSLSSASLAATRKLSAPPALSSTPGLAVEKSRAMEEEEQEPSAALPSFSPSSFSALQGLGESMAGTGVGSFLVTSSLAPARVSPLPPLSLSTLSGTSSSHSPAVNNQPTPRPAEDLAQGHFQAGGPPSLFLSSSSNLPPFAAPAPGSCGFQSATSFLPPLSPSPFRLEIPSTAILKDSPALSSLSLHKKVQGSSLATVNDAGRVKGKKKRPLPSTGHPSSPFVPTALPSPPALSSSTGSKGTTKCRVPKCTNVARSKGICKSHGGNRNCSVPGCTSSAQSRALCRAHGGGSRCTVPLCSSSAQSGGLCRTHGGGKLCLSPGCTRSARSGGACISHGGGKRCKVPGCTRSVQSRGVCKSHGANLRGGEGRERSGENSRGNTEGQQAAGRKAEGAGDDGSDSDASNRLAILCEVANAA